MRGRSHSRARFVLVGCFLLASAATSVFAQDKPASPAPAVATMSGMRSLVPTLVSVGWDGFFLDLGPRLGLSEGQYERLREIRNSELASSQELTKELEQAQLGLYQDLDSDRVSTEKLDLDLQEIATLQETAAATHFMAIIEAINVLNHKQHVRAEEWLKLRLKTLSHPPRDLKLAGANHSENKWWKLWKRHWPIEFTPQQSGWRAW